MSDLTTQATNINRTQNHRYRFRFSGLMPNTKHTLYVDGVDYGYATRQIGKDFGADLVSDVDGILDVFVLYEIPFNRNQNFELPQTPTLSFQEEIVNRQSSQNARRVENFVLFEVKNAAETSYAQYSMKMPLLLTPGAAETLFDVTF